MINSATPPISRTQHPIERDAIRAVCVEMARCDVEMQLLLRRGIKSDLKEWIGRLFRCPGWQYSQCASADSTSVWCLNSELQFEFDFFFRAAKTHLFALPV